LPTSPSLVARVTMTPVADRHQQRGICEDQAVADRQQLYVLMASPGDMPFCSMPTEKPPIRLTRVMIHGSDRVALERTSCRRPSRRRSPLGADLLAATAASFSSISPELRVRVDGHLLAGHRVEGEPGPHLGRTRAAPLVTTVSLDDHQDREDHQGITSRTADDECARRRRLTCPA